MAIWSYLVFALLAGAMLPIQFGINAQLATWVGGSIRAAFVSLRRRRGRAARSGALCTAGAPRPGGRRAVVGLDRRHSRRLLRARLDRDGTEARRRDPRRADPRRTGDRLAARRPPAGSASRRNTSAPLRVAGVVLLAAASRSCGCRDDYSLVTPGAAPSGGSRIRRCGQCGRCRAGAGHDVRPRRFSDDVHVRHASDR